MRPKSVRNLPLILLKTLQDFTEARRNDGFIHSIPEDTYWLVKDHNPGSPFFFHIENIELKHEEPQGNIIELTVEFAPASEFDLAPTRVVLNHGQLTNSYSLWQKLVYDYQQAEIYWEQNDTVLNQYIEEEYVNFTILDEGEKHSYPLRFQLFIDGYLSDVINSLAAHREEIQDEGKASQVNEIIADAQELKSTQTQLTRQEVARKLSTLWAKARKAGLNIYIEVRKELLKEGAKAILKGLLENFDDLSSGIKGLI